MIIFNCLILLTTQQQTHQTIGKTIVGRIYKHMITQTGGNPFDILANVKQRIVAEKGHDITEWDRIPAFKRSLLEISFNFVDDSLGQTGAPSQDIVPPWARWKEHYDPDHRNRERLDDASINGRDALASVDDRAGMILSANARLDVSSAKDKNVTLSENLWEELEARGFHWVDAFAQWKLTNGNDADTERRVLDQINSYREGARPVMSQLLRQIEDIQRDAASSIERLRSLNVKELVSKIRAINSDSEARQVPIRSKLNQYCNEVAKLQAKLPRRKGWFRVYFAHAHSPLFKELYTMDMVVRRLFPDNERVRSLRRDRKEMSADICELFKRTWGRAIVWNNPSTRTNIDSGDITRYPKTAIQLMNSPKSGRELATLGLFENFYQMK
jgi:hypothetical protein